MGGSQQRRSPVSVLAELLGGPTGSTLLISGGIGTGRTRLARMIAAAPPAMHSRLLSVRASIGIPMWLPRELVRLIGELVGERPKPPEDIARAGAQLRRLLSTPRRTRDVLVLDDVHLLDPAGAALLVDLLAVPAGRRTQLALTVRADWAERLPPELVAALTTLPRHELAALDTDELRRFGVEVIGAPLAEPTLRRVVEATGGNPAAVRGVLTEALRRDAVLVLDGVALLTPGYRLALPDWHPLLSRIDELPAPATAVAELIAVTGRPTVEGLAVGAEHDPGRLSAALRTLRAAGVLAEGEEPRIGIPVLADAIARRCPPWRRAAGQARWLAERRCADDSVLSRLARDTVAAGRPLRPEEQDILLGNSDGDGPPVPEGALAAGLLPFAATPPAAELVEPAIGHWVETGQWRRITRLSPESISSAVVLDRLRASLLSGGLTSALADVELLAESPALSAELLLFAGQPDQAELELPRGRLADLAEQPRLATDDVAVRAWSAGRWDTVLDLAVTDRRTGASAHQLACAEEPAALAAEVWLHRGRPEFSRQWLIAAPTAGEPLPRPLSEWAAAGVDLLHDRPREAADRLAGVLDWMAAQRYSRHRPLLLARQVTALAGSGQLAAATETLAELAATAELDGTASTRALWFVAALVLVEHGGPAVPDPNSVLEALVVAEAPPFELAKARLAVGRLSADTELIGLAAQGFAALGATLWQLRAVGAARAVDGTELPADSRASADELIMDLVTAGLSNASIATVLLHSEMYVKRQVSRLLRATDSRHRAQLAARVLEPLGPSSADDGTDPAVLLAETDQPVTVVLGPPGSGRSSVLLRTRKLLAGKATALLVHGSRAHDLGATLRGALTGRPGGDGDLTEDVAAVCAVLRDPMRSDPVTLLVDDADLLGSRGRSMLRALAHEAGPALRLIVAGSRFTADLAVLVELAGSPVRLPPLTPAEVGAAVAKRLQVELPPAALVALTERTAGNPGALAALLSLPPDPAAEPDGVLRGGPLGGVPEVAPSRAVAGLDQLSAPSLRAVALLAALPGDSPAQLWPALPLLELSMTQLQSVARQLMDLGLLVETEDGGTRFRVPLVGELLAARLPAPQRRAVHQALSVALLNARAEGRPVHQHRLAEHLVAAGAELGKDELVTAAQQVVDVDPLLAYGWSTALLASVSATADIRASAAIVTAKACYAMARYAEAVEAARAALELLVDERQSDAVVARTVLINSLVRTGQHDAALDIAAGTGSVGSVVDGLQQARILLLREQFDAALAVLAELRPADPRHRLAQLAGVRVLAAIGADGVAWQGAERRAELATPLPVDRLEQARQALAWGDLFTAERCVIAGAHPAPAARRSPPPSLGRLVAAVAALRVGEWASVRALAEEHAASGAEVTHADGVIAALAAETLVRQDKLAAAGELLAGISADQLFGHVIGWAAAGLDLAGGATRQAVERLAAVDQRCRRLGYLSGRELVLSRKVDAELADGDRAAAIRTSAELGELCTRINTRQARLYWLAGSLAIRPVEQVASAAAELAAELGDRFLAARVQLSEVEFGRPEALRGAYATFRELGAVRWQRRAAELMRANGVSVRLPQKLTAQHRQLIDLIAAGASNQQVAEALGVTEKAIEGRLTRLYRRTGLSTRADLVREYGDQRGIG
ncbi:MAG TPA: AAA family ATPase [Pseudonocardiaceae bacterium]|jgi:DNA-binding NarL/FixJ family response regulator|nr:AAA family ATPase [Pseudonocardiaceae bacterium]